MRTVSTLVFHRVSTQVFHRRRAQRFAQLLNEAGGLRRHHSRSELDDELARLLATSHRLRQVNPRIAPDLDFRVGLRAMLVATAEREGVNATVVLPAVEARPAGLARLARARPDLRRLTAPSARRVRARGAIIVGVAAGTLALSGMSAASGDAVPGDPLYGVKRSTERAQLALAGSEISRGQLYLEFAKTRVAEASAVRGDQSGLAGVLGDMDAETRHGVKLLTSAAVNRHDPVALDAIDRFVGVQRRNVAGLRDESGARTRVDESLELLDSVARRSAALRTSLSCGAAGSDALGPVPKRCGG